MNYIVFEPLAVLILGIMPFVVSAIFLLIGADMSFIPVIFSLVGGTYCGIFIGLYSAHLLRKHNET